MSLKTEEHPSGSRLQEEGIERPIFCGANNNNIESQDIHQKSHHDEDSVRFTAEQSADSSESNKETRVGIGNGMARMAVFLSRRTRP